MTLLHRLVMWLLWLPLLSTSLLKKYDPNHPQKKKSVSTNVLIFFLKAQQEAAAAASAAKKAAALAALGSNPLEHVSKVSRRFCYYYCYYYYNIFLIFNFFNFIFQFFYRLTALRICNWYIYIYFFFFLHQSVEKLFGNGCRHLFWLEPAFLFTAETK